jgi:hypothetical protein
MNTALPQYEPDDKPVGRAPEAIVGICSHNGRLYVATRDGIYRLGTDGFERLEFRVVPPPGETMIAIAFMVACGLGTIVLIAFVDWGP